MGIFTLLGLLLLILSFGVWQYRQLMKWKRELSNWQSLLNETQEEQTAATEMMNAWNRDLNRREIAWQCLKEKIEEDSKWKLKI